MSLSLLVGMTVCYCFSYFHTKTYNMGTVMRPSKPQHKTVPQFDYCAFTLLDTVSELLYLTYCFSYFPTKNIQYGYCNKCLEISVQESPTLLDTASVLFIKYVLFIALH